MTQTSNDTIQIFQILRELSIKSSKQFYEEDFNQDFLNKKLELELFKKGSSSWAKRRIILYNGVLKIFGPNELPLNTCPIEAKTIIVYHVGNIIEIQTPIRMICLKFLSDDNYNTFRQTILTCEQYQRPPVVVKVKNFQSNKLVYLHQACRDVCVNNRFNPQECVEHFPLLCEILRSVTRRRQITKGNKKEIIEEEIEYLKRQKETQRVPTKHEEDKLVRYTRSDNPNLIYKDFNVKW